MNNTIEYKGYIGSVEFSAADQVFFGKVQGIRSLISYEGTTAAELIEDFHGAVDDYLALCQEEGIEPEVAGNRTGSRIQREPEYQAQAGTPSQCSHLCHVSQSESEQFH